MPKITTVDGLAEALKDKGWQASKTTDKTMAVMSGLNNIPWERVRVFTLRWGLSGGEIVPSINLMMFKDGDQGETNLNVELIEKELVEKELTEKEVKDSIEDPIQDFELTEIMEARPIKKQTWDWKGDKEK